MGKAAVPIVMRKDLKQRLRAVAPRIGRSVQEFVLEGQKLNSSETP